MKNSINKKGFTLVELIIVITILAILATIAFISFQGYSAESRDAKIKAEIGNMRNVIEAEMAKGVSPLNYVSETGSNLTALDLNGTGVSVTDTTKYKAGDINKTLFSTNTSNTYKMGATPSLYQFAGKLTANSSETSYVLGNFTKRVTTGSGVGYFKVGDYVQFGTTSTSGAVTSVSTDKATIYIGTSSTGATNVKLLKDESAGLIGSKGALGTAVTDGSTTALPF